MRVRIDQPGQDQPVETSITSASGASIAAPTRSIRPRHEDVGGSV